VLFSNKIYKKCQLAMTGWHFFLIGIINEKRYHQVNKNI